MRLSVARRLGALGAVGAISVCVVATIGFSAAGQQAADAKAMAKISDGMSHQWNADMMHDGIRGDVMASMYASNDAQRQEFEVSDVSVKAKDIISNYDTAAAAAPPAVAARFAQVRPQLLQYAAQAQSLVALASSDKSAAEAQLPQFLSLFGQLEQKLGGIDDGMLKAVTSSEEVAQDAATSAKRHILIASLLALLLFAGVAVWIGRSMLARVNDILEALRAVARRDLKVRVESGDGDEFLEMGTALNGALQEIGGAIKSAGQAASTLSEACLGLTRVSAELGRAADETSEQADGVSASAYEVSANVSRMSNATDEMGSAIAEIAGQTSSAAQVASEAVRATEATSKSVADLSRASEEIGEIVRAITTIAEQTNLLALNATIEAARAGESGKGFAVVATEVKELSQETGRATDDITAKISMIQAMTGQASVAIDAITDVIRQINENQTMIAAAVEEQSATTAEISRGVSDIAHGAQHISGNMAAIAASTGTTSANARTTQESAAKLAALAGDVTTLIGRFSY